MGYIIEITESKMEHLAENAEKMLRYGGKVMQCIDELREESRHGEHGYGERGYGRGGRYGMRDEEEYDRDHMDGYDRMGERYHMDGYNRWEEMPPYMNERRGRSATTGRYISR